MSETMDRMMRALEAKQRAHDEIALGLMLKKYNSTYNEANDHPSIFTAVKPWQSDSKGWIWLLECNDGLGTYHIGDTFEEAIGWFMHRMYEMGYQAHMGRTAK